MKNFKFIKWVALRYLWSSRKDAAIWVISLFSILGVAIGVIVLNITMAVFSGFQSEFKQRLVGSEAHILVRSLGGQLPNWQNAIDKIKLIPEVSSYTPYTQNQALIKSASRSTGVIIRGILKDSPINDELKKYTDQPVLDELFSPKPLLQEDFEGNENEVLLPSILIGQELARNIGVFNGDLVSLMSPDVSSTPFGLLPKSRRFKVVGNYHSGLIEYENTLAYVPLESAQQLFGFNTTSDSGSVSGIEVRIKDLDKAPEIAKVILEELGGIGSGYIVQDWTTNNKPFFEALKLEKRVYFLVLLLIIIMASFSIVSSLIMVVLEKQRDIAIFRSVGADSTTVRDIFRLQGTIIGGIGVFLGILGAIIGCYFLKYYGFPIDERIFQMSKLPIKINPENFVLTGLSALFICFLATIYPAKRAAKLNPTEILRNE